jgi:hypothetical protein
MDAEKQFGRSARPSPDVTYQPDVVMPRAGAGAILGVSADGLVWTIDPAAEGAADIAPGKVLVLTNRAAGRVLAVQKSADGIQVVLGPAEITDIVREGRFSVEQPVDFGQGLEFALPDSFNPVQTIEPITALSEPPSLHGRFQRAAFIQASNAAGPAFKLTPLVSNSGIGVQVASTADGVRFLGQVVLYLNAPSLKFYLDIQGGKITVCEVELKGAAGVMFNFEAASPNPTAANINERRFVPVDFSIPIVGMGVPFAVNVRQLLELRTVFTSTGSLKSQGYFTLSGGLRVGYRDGKFGLGGPTGFSVKRNMVDTTEGVAFGVTGLVMIHHVKVIVGVGLAGFVTGPYVYLNSAGTVTNGSDLGYVKCRQATVSMAMGAGVGYMMAQPVTNAINAVLRALNIREIQGSGGIQTNPQTVVQTGWYKPAVKACGGSSS